ncbi:hypothetical protein [Piscirickettsia litoralis]|uniref:hypothetical protein n=1 Tax=Piscirickettsia litoralis TaxID=1891921 RepID=UPI001F46F384|nr:hypothetical protein [Piscirickettsia litoralis]
MSTKFIETINDFLADVAIKKEYTDNLAESDDLKVIDDIRAKQKTKLDIKSLDDARDYKQMLWRLSTFYMSIAVLLTRNNKIVSKQCLTLAKYITESEDNGNNEARAYTAFQKVKPVFQRIDASITALKNKFSIMTSSDLSNEFVRAFASLSQDDGSQQTFSDSLRKHIINTDEKVPRPHIFQALYTLVIESFSISCYQDVFKIYLMIIQEFGDQGISKMQDLPSDDPANLSAVVKKCRDSSDKISECMRILNSSRQSIAISGDAATKMTTQSKELQKAFDRAREQLECLHGEVQFQMRLKSEFFRLKRNFGLSQLRRVLKENKSHVHLSMNEQFDNVKDYTARIQQYILSAYNINYENEGERLSDQQALDLIDSEMSQITNSVSQHYMSTLESMPT